MGRDRPLLFSLRLKLGAALLFTVLLSMAVLAVMLLSMYRAELLRNHLDRAGLIARSVERSLRLADDYLPRGESRSATAMQRALLLAMAEPDVEALALRDADNRELARQGALGPPPADRWETAPGGMLYRLGEGPGRDMLVEVTLAGPTPSRLLLRLSLTGMDRALLLSRAKTILQISLSSLLIVLFLVAALTVVVISPLGTLARGMERVADGRLDHQARLETRDEIGSLASSFNAMVTALRENRRTIEEQLAALLAAGRATIEAQQRLIVAEKMASLGTLAAGVAHEVGNPLGAVIGYIALLRKQTLPPAETAECLERAAAELERIHRIMLELLDYARPTPEPCGPLDVNGLLVSLVEDLGHEGLLEHLEVHLDLDPAILPTSGSPHKLRQVAANIVRNAVWATRPRGSLRVATAPGLPGDREVIAVSFTDDGRGIPPEALERIFDPFFTTRLGQGGTGLGLAISRRIVEDLGGTITARSLPGQTSFVITLPVCYPQSDG